MDREREARRRRNRGSSLLFGALAVVLIGIAIYAYTTQREDDEPVTAAPPEIVGYSQLINVQQVIQAQGLTVEAGRGTARATGLTNPGQLLTVDDAKAYVFIYPDTAQRAAEADGLDPATLTLVSLGTPIAGPGDALQVSARSNVVVILVGGDADLQAKVAAAVDSLPEPSPGAASRRSIPAA